MMCWRYSDTTGPETAAAAAILCNRFILSLSYHEGAYRWYDMVVRNKRHHQPHLADHQHKLITLYLRYESHLL